VFPNPQSRLREELATQKVVKDGGNMGRITMLIHNAKFTGKQKFCPGRK